jgi:Squalene-hopene cyclase C-terminal domain
VIERVCCVWLFAIFTGGAAFGAAASGEGERSERADASQFDQRAHEVASRGLAWLALQQQENGSFSTAIGEDGVTRAPVAMTALATLAFMAGGSTLGRGPYRECVARGVKFLLKEGRRDYRFLGRQVDAGGIEREVDVTLPYFSLVDDSTSKMHGHGYATLALAEAYGTYKVDLSYGDHALEKAREDQKQLRDVLVGAVQLIEFSQTREGGWYYDPGSTEHEGSVTITMIQALRAARDVGISVNKRVIDDAVKYIHESQREQDGGFRYAKTSAQHSYALTAAAIATLNATGDYASEVIDRGIEYMQERDPLLNPGRFARDEHPYYARLYAAQAYFVYRDPKLFERWREHVLDEFENDQDGKGAIGGSDYGRVYSTASACLVLLMTDQYLPMFQR